MLCRVADDLFWVGRYVERAIAVGRLIEVTWHLELDAGAPQSDHAAFWAPLVSEVALDSPAPQASTPSPLGVRRLLAFDTENPNSMVSCIRQARGAARRVRESISTEMWEQINTLYLSLADADLAVEAEEAPHVFYKRVREAAQFFQGLADCTLAHDEAWHFICLGQYLERADIVTRVLNLQARALMTGGGPSTDNTVYWLAVLRSCGAAEAYARYYSLRVEPARVVEFLLLNPGFPQTVRFSMDAAWSSLQQVATAQGGPRQDPGSAVRALGRLRARLEHVAVDEVLEEGMEQFLGRALRQIADASDEVTRSYLRGEAPPSRLVATARAALMMAQQQQQ